MELDVVFTAQEVDRALVQEKNAVVIDVLRATTTMISSLAYGCKTIFPVTEPEEGQGLLTKALAQGELRANYILGGERGGVLIPGYDLGNSPFEYRTEIIKGKNLIFCTTNGTLAINKAKFAKRLFLGALVNGKAMANKLNQFTDSIVVVCAGTKGHFTLEDVLAAGLIIHELLILNPGIELSDRAHASLALYRYHQAELVKAVSLSRHAKVLVSLGFEKDIAYCAQRSVFDFVPIYKDGQITLS